MTRRRCIPAYVKAAVFEYVDCKLNSWQLVYCSYCMEESDWFWLDARLRLPEGFHWDHRVPVSAGGTNTFDNIVIACAPCNLSKGSKVDWLGPVARWKLENYPDEYAHLTLGGAW